MFPSSLCLSDTFAGHNEVITAESRISILLDINIVSKKRLLQFL